MKLAKKMLACVMALAMVAVLGLTAFAAAPTITTTATKATVGEKMTVTVKATSGFTGAESGSMFFTYDPAVLEFVDIATKGNVADAMCVGGPVLNSDNQVSFAFTYTEASEVDSTVLTVITFKVIAAGDASVTYTTEDWAGVDTPAGGTVAITASEKVDVVTTEKPVVTTAEPGTGVKPTGTQTPQTGATVAVSAIAGVMAIAAVAFVATRKKDEE